MEVKHTYQTAFEAFSAFSDGLTVFEFTELMDTEEDKRNASGRLSQFVKEGLAEKAGQRLNKSTGNLCSVYKPNGSTFDQRLMEKRDERRKRRRPTDRELVELRQWKADVDRELDELYQWKADAIKRFPELGLDPAILSARRKVASILRSEGNDTKAALVERGELDDGETMRIVLSVMRGEA